MPEVFISFTKGIRDDANRIAVGTQGDHVKVIKAEGTIDSYAGEFHNSRLILWRFAGAHLPPPLIIKFFFQEKPYGTASAQGAGPEVLVSDGSYNKPGSVVITLDRSAKAVTATLVTKGEKYEQPATLTVAYEVTRLHK